MHFQVNKDEYFNEILTRLKLIVPEFNSIFDVEDGEYPILGEFSRYLISNSNNEIILQKCASFINEALEKGKSETEDAIVLQVFQSIYDDSLVCLKLRPFLSEKSLQIFDKFLAL